MECRKRGRLGLDPVISTSVILPNIYQTSCHLCKSNWDACKNHGTWGSIYLGGGWYIWGYWGWYCCYSTPYFDISAWTFICVVRHHSQVPHPEVCCVLSVVQIGLNRHVVIQMEPPNWLTPKACKCLKGQVWRDFTVSSFHGHLGWT